MAEETVVEGLAFEEDPKGAVHKLITSLYNYRHTLDPTCTSRHIMIRYEGR